MWFYLYLSPENKFFLTKLWKLNIGETEMCNNIHQLKNVQNMVQFVYEALFCPALSTLQHAIKNNFLSAFPYINDPKSFWYITETDATIKGHLDTERKNTRSTTKQSNTKVTNEQDNQNQVFCTVQHLNTGKIYTDQTGKMSRLSSLGNQYLFICYVYDLNLIFGLPLKTREKGEILKHMQQ